MESDKHQDSTNQITEPEIQKSQNKIESKINPCQYTIFRLDGHSFSKFVKAFSMNLPFDKNFTAAMKATANQAFKYYSFFIGFVGSDEITYAMRPLTKQQQQKGATLQFSGRMEKMVSLLAGMVSTTFFKELTRLEGFQKTQNFSPHFDCRVFQVLTLKEVLQNISERVVYTLRNSRMMLAQSHYSQKQLHKLASKEAVQKLLKEKEIDFDEVVHGDNRVGNVILIKKVKCKKVIEIKGDKNEIQFERRETILVNKGPKEVLQLQKQLLAVNEP